VTKNKNIKNLLVEEINRKEATAGSLTMKKHGIKEIR
jgi:hypothetical protein